MQSLESRIFEKAEHLWASMIGSRGSYSGMKPMTRIVTQRLVDYEAVHRSVLAAMQVGPSPHKEQQLGGW